MDKDYFPELGDKEKEAAEKIVASLGGFSYEGAKYILDLIQLRLGEFAFMRSSGSGEDSQRFPSSL